MMKEQLTERLEKLKSEFESGQKMLADLQARQANLQQTLLRISGAIQILEEILTSEPTPGTNGGVSSPLMVNEIDAAA